MVLTTSDHKVDWSVIQSTKKDYQDIVLGIDIGGQWKIITSTGKQFRGTRLDILITDLLLFCQGNKYLYLAIENPRLISQKNKHTKAMLTAIQDISRSYPIDIILVDPMKTSKICHRCHSEAKQSRTTYNTFECTYCNLKVSSDYNAAVNIRERAIQILTA